MKTKEINGKNLKFYGADVEDNFIGVGFNSQDLDLENPFFKNNGLEKEVKATKIIIDLENKQILTEKKTYSITPTGDKVDITTNPVFLTSAEDTDLFLSQANGLLIPAIQKGILMDMGLVEDKRKQENETLDSEQENEAVDSE